jgi:histidine ammonia-lyase
VEINAARVQDPYGYRAFPQVHGPALESVEHAAAVLEAELNGSAENPLIDVAGQAVWHNGNFHAAYVGLALDAIRAALFQTAALSVARLGTLMEPAFTGLNAFLAEDRASSGVLILEYVAHSAVADIRRFAAPAALGGAVLSRGVEDHAGFATQSARASSDTVAAYRAVLACELISATRALRMQGRVPGGALRRAFDLADSALERGAADRPLDSDLSAAETVLPGIAAVVSWPGAGPVTIG